MAMGIKPPPDEALERPFIEKGEDVELDAAGAEKS
jgi:hypothetical protein